MRICHKLKVKPSILSNQAIIFAAQFGQFNSCAHGFMSFHAMYHFVVGMPKYILCCISFFSFISLSFSLLLRVQRCNCWFEFVSNCVWAFAKCYWWFGFKTKCFHCNGKLSLIAECVPMCPNIIHISNEQCDKCMSHAGKSRNHQLVFSSERMSIEFWRKKTFNVRAHTICVIHVDGNVSKYFESIPIGRLIRWNSCEPFFFVWCTVEIWNLFSCGSRSYICTYVHLKMR